MTCETARGPDGDPTLASAPSIPRPIPRQASPDRSESLPDDPATVAGATFTTDPSASEALASPRAEWWWRWGKVPAEALVSLVAAYGFLIASGRIRINPMVRVGQVSGLAKLQLYFAVAAIVLVVALIVAERTLPRTWRRWLVPLACAAAAGLFTGLVAGGIRVALNGTQYGLWAGMGDWAWIGTWATSVMQGHGLPAYHYPPIPIYALAGWAELTHQPIEFAMKDIQLIGTAMFGPATYLAWRLLTRPVFALGVGVVAMIPFLEPVKTYPQLSLVVMIPVLIKFLDVLRRSAERTVARSLLAGIGLGVGLGLLFMLYSGWFIWCAIGFVGAYVLVVPKRGAWPQVLTLSAAAAVSFVATTWVHLMGLLAPTGAVSDRFFYFDTDTDPAYFAMWRNDRPGNTGPWPPLGELGNVGLFTLLLVLGVGVALWLGWRRTTVLAVGLIAVGAWLMRMYLAGAAYSTGTVRLYPRTTMVLLYCTLILTGVAVVLAARLFLRIIPKPVTWPQRPPVGLLLVPVLMLFAFTGSATIDTFMPGARGSMGDFATDAHIHNLPDGSCPRYGLHHGCTPAHK